MSSPSLTTPDTTSAPPPQPLPLPMVPRGVWVNELFCYKWDKRGCDRSECPLIHISREERQAQVGELAKQGYPVRFCLRHLKSVHQGKPGKICRGLGLNNCGFYHGTPEEESHMLKQLNKIADPNILPRSAICRFHLSPQGCPLRNAADVTDSETVCHLVHPIYRQNFLELIAGKTTDEEIAEVFPSAPRIPVSKGGGSSTEAATTAGDGAGNSTPSTKSVSSSVVDDSAGKKEKDHHGYQRESGASSSSFISGRSTEDTPPSYFNSPASSGGVTRSMASTSTTTAGSMLSPAAVASKGYIGAVVMGSSNNNNHPVSQSKAAPPPPPGPPQKLPSTTTANAAQLTRVKGRNLAEEIQPGHWANELYCDRLKIGSVEVKCPSGDPSLCPLIHCSREQRDADLETMCAAGVPVQFCLRHINSLSKSGKAKNCRNCAFYHGTLEEFYKMNEALSHCSDPKKLPREAVCRAYLLGQCSDPKCRHVHPKVLARFKQSIRGKSTEEIEEMYPSAPASFKKEAAATKVAAAEETLADERALDGKHEEEANIAHMRALVASIKEKTEGGGGIGVDPPPQYGTSHHQSSHSHPSSVGRNSQPPGLINKMLAPLSVSAKPFVPMMSSEAYHAAVASSTTDDDPSGACKSDYTTTAGAPPLTTSTSSTREIAPTTTPSQHVSSSAAGSSSRISPEDKTVAARVNKNSVISSERRNSSNSSTKNDEQPRDLSISPPLRMHQQQQQHVDPSLMSPPSVVGPRSGGVSPPQPSSNPTLAMGGSPNNNSTDGGGVLSAAGVVPPTMTMMMGTTLPGAPNPRVPIPRDRAVVVKFHSDTPKQVIRGVLNFGGTLTHVKTRTKSDIEQIAVCAYYKSVDTAKVFPMLANHFFGSALAAPGAIPLKEHLKSNPTDQFYFEVKVKKEELLKESEEESITECDFGLVPEPGGPKVPLPEMVVSLIQQFVAVTPEAVQEFLLNLEDDEEEEE